MRWSLGLGVVVVLSALGLGWCAAPGRAEGPALASGRVGIVVLGAFDPGLVTAVRDGLEERLGMPSEVLATRPLPRAAYYAPRRRYRAERLLDHLRPWQASAPGIRTVLGLTSVDISTTKDRHPDWGIFGLGDIDGPAAVVSDFRLRRGHPSAEQRRFRVVSTAVRHSRRASVSRIIWSKPALLVRPPCQSRSKSIRTRLEVSP